MALTFARDCALFNIAPAASLIDASAPFTMNTSFGYTARVGGKKRSVTFQAGLLSEQLEVDRLVPLRQGNNHREARNVAGYRNVGGQQIYTESFLESKNVAFFDVCRDVHSVASQPLRITATIDSKPWVHVVDYAVRFHDGTLGFVDVRPTVLQTKRFLSDVTVSAEAFAVAGVSYWVSCGPDAQVWANIRMLTKHRDPLHPSLRPLLTAFSDVPYPLTVSELLGLFPEQRKPVVQVLLHLITVGDLCFDITMPFDSDTTISRVSS